MNGLLSRVLQRATHPGGGLEPLRASRAALRAGAGSFMAFPAEEVHETVAPAHVANTTVMSTSGETAAFAVRPPSPRGELQASATSRAVSRHQMERALTDEMVNASSRETIAGHRDSNSAVNTEAERPSSGGDNNRTKSSSEHSYTAKKDLSETLKTRARMSSDPLPLEVNTEDVADAGELQMPPTLEISIGHIEVQVAARATERPRTPPFRPRVSLHDFLSRSGRR